VRQKSEPTLAEVSAEIRNYVERHKGDDLEEVLAYWRHLHRWGWCGKGLFLADIEEAVRIAKGVA